MTEFSDEMLTAYLDGEVSAKDARNIEGALVSDAHLAARLSDLTIEKDSLQAAFDDVLHVAPTPPDLTNVSSLSPKRGSEFMKIAAAALLALGLGWFWGQSREDLQDWQEFAAAYHRLYTPETLEAANFTDQDLTNQLEIVSDAIGYEISLDDLRSIEGLSLKRAQVLGYGDGKIAHLAFVDAVGNPVALCVSDLAEGERTEASAYGMATASWSHASHSFYLIGGSDIGLVQHIARQFPKS